MPAAYAFVSHWRVGAAPERCWDELERMLRPGAVSWWRGVAIVRSSTRSPDRAGFDLLGAPAHTP